MIIEKAGLTEEGFNYIVVLKYDTGHRNGYVSVPESNPLYKVGYSFNDLKDVYVEVHGGLTYSGFLTGYYFGAENPWYFGFDCQHVDDKMIPPKDIEEVLKKFYSSDRINIIMDRYNAMYNIMIECDFIKDKSSTIKSCSYVEKECFKLSKQLKSIERLLCQ